MAARGLRAAPAGLRPLTLGALALGAVGLCGGLLYYAGQDRPASLEPVVLPTSNMGLPFFDDFESGFGQWEVASGNWRLAPGKGIQGGTALEARISEGQAHEQAVILARCAPETDRFEIRFQMQQPHPEEPVWFGVHAGRRGSPLVWNLLRSVAGKQWVECRIVYRSGEYEWSLTRNDKPYRTPRRGGRPKSNWSSLSRENRQIALRAMALTENLSIFFDDVRIVALDDEETAGER